MLHSTFHPGDRVLSRFGMATVLEIEGIFHLKAKLIGEHPALPDGIVTDAPSRFLRPSPCVLVTKSHVAGAVVLVSARMVPSSVAQSFLHDGHHSDEERFLIRGESGMRVCLQSTELGVPPEGPYLFVQAPLDRTGRFVRPPGRRCDRGDCIHHDEISGDFSFSLPAGITLDRWVRQYVGQMYPQTGGGIRYYCILEMGEQLHHRVCWEAIQCEGGWVEVPMEGTTEPEYAATG